MAKLLRSAFAVQAGVILDDSSQYRPDHEICAHAMVEATVIGATKDGVCESELVDLSQALKLRRIDQSHRQRTPLLGSVNLVLI
jgi:hypothetical protein